ncbi:PEP-CTERM sorting domain-containing protein [Haloferula sp.]|uniref:PEP-CTERM sorting domain-containing protein n=1 Tax=Haloferula sp. TaxID=2497595 RepID=UPI00329AB63E
MKNSTIATASALFVICANTASAVTLSIESSAPTTDILLQNATAGNTGSQQTFASLAADAAGTEGTRARGATTIVDLDGAASYPISSITVLAASAESFDANAEFDFFVFDLGSDQNPATNGWTSGDGMQDGDPLDGTGLSLLLSQTFSLNGLTPGTADVYTFNFSGGELTFNEDNAYGFLIQFKDPDYTSGTETQGVAFETTTTDTYLLQTTSSGNQNSGSRNLVYTITTVPEPSVALLGGLGLLGLLRRRRG